MKRIDARQNVAIPLFWELPKAMLPLTHSDITRKHGKIARPCKGYVCPLWSVEAGQGQSKSSKVII